jgi:hypothetical protein
MIDITEISAVVAAAGVLVGVAYYILDMRNQGKIRLTEIVMRLYSEFRSMEFQKAWNDILTREAKDADDYVKKYGYEELTSVGMFFEGIGILLKRGLVGIELVDDMFTSPIKWTWEKMRYYTMEARRRRNAPEIFEWFEYLYNEMKKRE